MHAPSRIRAMATAVPSSDGDRRDDRFGTDVSKTDLGLKAGAYRLLLGMNYSTGIDVAVLGISEPRCQNQDLLVWLGLAGGLRSLVR
jgi:hypothetical protein